ncbi:MAG: FAD-dependent oxidoreductase [Deinococcales bacterium]
MTRLKRHLKTKVIIVGGGISAVALAYHLSRSYQGLDIKLITQDALGEGGASALPLALLNPYRGQSARASALDLAGLRTMRALVSELGAAETGLAFKGVWRIPSSIRQAKKWQKQVGEGGRRIRAHPPTTPHGAFLVSKGGHVNVKTFFQTLKNWLCVQQDNNFELIEYCQVTALDGQGLIAQGKLWQAEKLIFCTGAASPKLLAPYLKEYNLSCYAGEIISFESDIELDKPLAGAVYGGSLAKHLHVGGNHRELTAGENLGPTPEDLKQLQNSVSWFIPPLKDLTPLRTWTGLRLKTPDHQPLSLRLTDKHYFFGAMAGRGFLCAFHLAESLAQQLFSD